MKKLWIAALLGLMLALSDAVEKRQKMRKKPLRWRKGSIKFKFSQPKVRLCL